MEEDLKNEESIAVYRNQHCRAGGLKHCCKASGRGSISLRQWNQLFESSGVCRRVWFRGVIHIAGHFQVDGQVEHRRPGDHAAPFRHGNLADEYRAEAGCSGGHRHAGCGCF